MTRVETMARYGLAVLALLGGVTPVSAQADAPDLAAITRRIEAWTRGVLDTTGIPAISIALVRDNQVAWTGAYGRANVAAGVPATPDTYFNTGSTFKFVTAAAVMPLWSREVPLSPEETLARTRRTQPPGTEHRYCNVCYIVLEYVIEKVSGVPYDRYIAENILQPLGLDIASASVPSPQVVERMAVPYQVTDGTPAAVGQVRYNSFAAGDAYLRPADMARFLVSQLNGGVYAETRILDEASVAEMPRVQFEGSNDGLGIVVRELSGRTVIRHGGSIPGFKAVLMGDPASGSGVYIMSNATQAERAINLLGWYSMMLLWGEDVEPPSIDSAGHGSGTSARVFSSRSKRRLEPSSSAWPMPAHGRASERRAERERAMDAQYRAEFGRRVREHFPGCPPKEDSAEAY